MATEERHERFRRDVAGLKLGTGRRSLERAVRVVSLMLMTAGVVIAFGSYRSSLTKNDLRDIASLQILTTAALAVCVVGAALYCAAAIVPTGHVAGQTRDR
jgi:hypothetical protein